MGFGLGVRGFFRFKIRWSFKKLDSIFEAGRDFGYIFADLFSINSLKIFYAWKLVGGSVIYCSKNAALEHHDCHYCLLGTVFN